MNDEDNDENLDDDDATPQHTVRYYSVSGNSHRDCVFLAVRYNEEWGFHVREGESWVASIAPDSAEPESSLTVTLHLGTQGWYTGIWRGTDGHVFVSEVSGRLYNNPDLSSPAAATTWNTELIDCSARGIWGLDSTSVYTWGARQGIGAIHRWDGAAWAAMPPPPFVPWSLHGVSPHHMWIGGPRGATAFWDGSQWRVMPTETDETITCIHTVNQTLAYAAGDGGSILEGSPHGWTPIGSIPDAMPGDVYDITVWNDTLWVAAGPRGIWERTGTTNQFTQADDRADAVAVNGGTELLMACGEKLSGTIDGVDFRYSALDTVYEIREPFALGDI